MMRDRADRSRRRVEVRRPRAGSPRPTPSRPLAPRRVAARRGSGPLRFVVGVDPVGVLDGQRAHAVGAGGVELVGPFHPLDGPSSGDARFGVGQAVGDHPVAHDDGGVGPLNLDQEGVAEAVPGGPGSHPQPPLPEGAWVPGNLCVGGT